MSTGSRARIRSQWQHDVRGERDLFQILDLGHSKWYWDFCILTEEPE